MRGKPFLYPAAVARLIGDLLARGEEPHAIRRGLVEP
jgi:hypothetical protein